MPRLTPSGVVYGSIAVILAVVFLAPFLAFLPLNGISVGGLEADVKRTLPVGSTREEALAWIASRGFEHRATRDSEGIEGLYVIVPNSSLLERADIDLSLDFDANGKLRAWKARRFVVSF